MNAVLLPHETYGDPTQRTFVAPYRRKMWCTWRQAMTYRAAVLPLTPGDHGCHLPFISWAKRR